MHELLGKTLCDFEILRELGRGGMGVVDEACQLSLNRKVALKVLSGGLGLTGNAVQRFQREAEAAAKLHHSNIVPVYATGAQNDTHYYAMELIEGLFLDHVIRQMRQARDGQSSRPPGGGENVLVTSPTGPYIGESSPAASSAAPLSSSSLNSGSHYFDTVARMIADVADALAGETRLLRGFIAL
jgi:serine/threonine protein kinase